MAMKSFTLKERYHNLCLTIQGKKKNKIVATNCSSSSLNMRWIWVNKTGKVHLMNIMTLQCLQFLTKGDVCKPGQNVLTNQTGQVAMKQCNDIDGQHIFKTNTIIDSYPCENKLSKNRRYYLKLNRQHNDSPYPVQSQRNPTPAHEWTNKGDTLDQRNSSYTGQYSVLGQ